jgi:general secretion pathway protein M
MNATARLNNAKQSFFRFWSARNKREQNMLIAATAVVVLGLIYALLIDPALSGRADLEKKLPAWRQQAAEVQSLAKEAAGLGGTASAVPPPVTKESLESSLSRKGLKVQNVSVTSDLARVQLNGVSFAGVVDWLDDMQKTARLSVVEASLVAQDKPDTVNATLSLRQQRGE